MNQRLNNQDNKSWKIQPLSDIVEKIIDNRGKTPPFNLSSGCRLIESWQIKISSKYPLFSEEKQKYVSEDCYRNWFRDVHPQHKDILFSTVGASVPQFCLTPSEEEICIAQNVIGIRANKKLIYQDFLLFLFKTQKFINLVKNLLIVTVQPSIKISHLLSIPVTMPSLAEQEEIIDVLASLEDKIEILRRQNITLEKLAHALFHKWFIQGAKPEWENTYLTKIYDFESGARVRSKDYCKEELPGTIRYTRVRDMEHARADIFIKSELTDKKCAPYDLLVSFDGTVGKVAYGLSGTYSSGLRKITSKNEIYNNLSFKYLLFKRPEIINTIKSNALGTVILHAFSSAELLKFRLPSPKVISQFTMITNPLFNRILANRQQIVTLENTRDILLPQLMNEKIKIMRG